MSYNQDNSCVNCDECKCFTCIFRDMNIIPIAIRCNRCDKCNDIPQKECENYEYTDL